MRKASVWSGISGQSRTVLHAHTSLLTVPETILISSNARTAGFMGAEGAASVIVALIQHLASAVLDQSVGNQQ